MLYIYSVKSFLYIAAGGAIGAVVRFAVGQLLKPTSATSFPLHTFVINLTGCFLIGIAAAYLLRHAEADLLKYLIITGVLGGYTTFSSFALETLQLMQAQKFVMAIWYVALSNVTGIAACFGGYYMIKNLS